VDGTGNWYNYWLPPGAARNLVYSECGSTAYGCASTANWPIRGYHQLSSIRQGWVACATGATTKTLCGEVTDFPNGGIRMNILRHPGDSGGPLWSQVDSYGYGILTYSYSSPMSDYSALSSIFSHATAKSGLTFNVNTS
jgi:hypothetical protein